MATIRTPILNGSTLLDSSGSVFVEPSSVKDANDLFDRLVLVFNDTATRLTIRGSFRVPPGFSSAPRIKGRWFTAATTGQVRWEFDYRAIAAGEPSDPSAAQESVGHTQTAPGTARNYAEFDMALTGANIAADDVVQFTLARDGAEASPNDDTVAGAVMVELSSVVFEFATA